MPQGTSRIYDADQNGFDITVNFNAVEVSDGGGEFQRSWISYEPESMMVDEIDMTFDEADDRFGQGELIKAIDRAEEDARTGWSS